MDPHAPSLEAQGEYWGGWGVESRRGEGKGDPYDDRVCQLVRLVAARCACHERAADVGCGTGWLTSVLAGEFEHVWATELAPASLRVARNSAPSAEFSEGDFLTLELPPAGDLTVTCEVIAHVSDQPAFLERCRQLTKTGGRLLLLTQNPLTWSRNSYAHSPNERQLRHWLSRAAVRALCETAGFRIESIRTLEPMGDQGLLWWRPYAQGALRRIVGRPRAKALFERIGLGRTLAIEAVAA